MTERLIRGRTLTFLREPEGPADNASFSYREDGAVLTRDGRIIACGEYDQVQALAGAERIEDDWRPHLILPGFIDPHLHLPQMQVVGSWAANLLDWLNHYTFIEEQRFSDPVHCEGMATRFCDELIRNGTTTASVYCSVHAQSADAFFAECARRNLRMIAGKVMMDRNAPPALCDTAETGYYESSALIRRWHGKGRALYAITPRFALTSTPAQMEAARALAAEYPDCHIQTHLSENHGEIALAGELYPQAPDYAGIYEEYGLLGPKTLLGHCIHLSERERRALAESGSAAIFCPTSNLFLGSGLFNRQALMADGVRIGIATDIGGGTSYSMLKTLDEGYKVLQLQGQRLSPIESFHLMTLGNAEALSLADRIGTLEPGSEADLVVLDSRATPAMRIRMETVTSLAEELFILQTMGDDRAIAETYIAGVPAKSALAALE